MTALQTLLTLMALLVVLASAWTDLEGRRIPNRLLMVFLLVGLALRLSLGDMDSIEAALIRTAMVASVFIPVFVIRGMGAGDVKLFMLLAFLLEKDATLLMVTLSLIFGGLFGVVELLRLRLQAYLRPRLVLDRSGWSESARHAGIPYALPIAAGTFLTVFIEGQFHSLVLMVQGMS